MGPIAVVEVVRALGSWDLQLTSDTPQEIADLILAGRFGHVAVDAARDNPEVLGDELLATARYVGVLRGISHEADRLALSGSGMAFWLGAEDGLGDVFEEPVPFQDAAFEFVAAGLLPPSGAVTAGTFTEPAGYTPYTQTHRYQTSRQALDFFCDLRGCDWRVNGDATLDVGPPEALFAVEPRAAVIARAEGVDMDLRALPGAARLDSDVQDFSTRVVTLAEGEGTAIAVGTADIAVNPYVDLHGHPIKLTRLVSESNTSATNADDRAAIALAQYTVPRDSLTVSTATHDIRGDVQPGDRVWVYDPSAGLVDTENERVFRGDRISPVMLRVFQVNWPIERGMGVYFRTPDGRWLDLTDYVEFEESETALTVGGYDRALTNQQEPVGWRPNATNQADSSIPGAVVWSPPFDQFLNVGQGGLSRGSVQLAWIPPASNTDGSTFVDGSHFEIRHRRSDFQPTWANLGGVTWGDLTGKPWGALSGGEPVSGEDWTYTAVPIDSSTFLLQDLDPGQGYEMQIRAVDGANPPNVGDWTASELVWVGADAIPPATPAAPVVAASLVQVSVRHTLGLASGGTFNLPLDLAYLEVHVGETETFTTSAATRVGKIIATRAQLAANVTVVGAFPVAVPDQVWVRVIAVDQSGNESQPSAAAPVTVQLIDSQWVSDLTADKITAGDFTASYGLVGLFTAGNPDGARFSAGYDGEHNGFMLHRSDGSLAIHGDANSGNLRLYAPDGLTTTMEFDAATGAIDIVGTVSTGQTGQRVVVSGVGNEIRFYPQQGETRIGRIRSFIPENFPDDIALEMRASDSDTSDDTAVLQALPDRALMFTSPAGSVNQSHGMAQVTPDSTVLWYRTTGTGDRDAVIRLDTNGIRFTSETGKNITANRPFGDTASGVSLHAQSGSSAGYRLWWGNNTMNFVDNATNNPVKSFVVPHPTDGDRWLVHGCTESPTAGVEYWGEVEIVDHAAIVPLPDYFETLTTEDRQVWVSVIAPDEPADLLAGPAPMAGPARESEPWPPPYATPALPEWMQLCSVAASAPRDGKFRIACSGPDGTRVAWLVKATRKGADFPVEPLRSEVAVRGDGPYRYLTMRKIE